MSVGGEGRKVMQASVLPYVSSIISSPQQLSMEVQMRGKQLAGAGGRSATAAAATSSPFSHTATATAAEPERLAVTNLQRSDANAALSHTTSEVNFLRTKYLKC